MSSSSSKKGSSRKDGRSSSQRSSSKSQSSSSYQPELSLQSTSLEPQEEEVDLSQWGKWLVDSYDRVYRERRLPDGKWVFDFQTSESVPRTQPEPDPVGTGQDSDPQGNDFYQNNSPSYMYGQKYDTSETQPSYLDSNSSTPKPTTFPVKPLPLYMSSSSESPMSPGLGTIPENFRSLNMAEPLKYNPLPMVRMVDDSGRPDPNAVPPYQAAPIGRGGYTQKPQRRLETDDKERGNDDLQSQLSPPQNRFISGDAGGAVEDAAREANKLNPAFKVHDAKHFKFGAVFKIYWSEPMGQGNDRANGDGTDKIRIDLKYGELCYASIRRFIVAVEKDGHCLCLPILTYGRQATTKKGVKAQDHAIIYTTSSKEGATKLVKPQGEDDLQKTPIRINPKNSRDKLDSLSRLNYAKIYTVEYNVKVCFIGNIHDKSVSSFKRDYDLTHTPLAQYPDTEFPDEDHPGKTGQGEPHRRPSHSTPNDKARHRGK